MVVTRAIEFRIGQELPNKGMTVYDADGELIDLSGGYVFTWVIGYPGVVGLLDTGITITGAATAPNLILTVAADAFDTMSPGQYSMEIFARSGLRDRDWLFPIIIKPKIMEVV